MTLVLSDFDGTVTRSDSLLGFIRFAVGNIRLFKGAVRLSMTLLLQKSGFLRNDTAKERVMHHFFAGWSETEFRRVAARYAEQELPRIVRPEAIAALQKYRDGGARVVIVSASADAWLRPWCDRYGFELLATGMEVKNGLLTGRFGTKNCHGEEKAVRIRELLDPSAYRPIVAFGDSSGDDQMLAMADEAHYKPFRRPSRA